MLSKRSATCRMPELLELLHGAGLPATPRVRGSTMRQA